MAQAWEAWENAEDGRYPLYDKVTGERMYDVNARQLIQNVFGPSPAETTEKRVKHRGKVLAKKELQDFRKAIANAMVKGNMKEVNRILARVPDAGLPFVQPSEEGIKSAFMRRNVPQELRDAWDRGQWQFYYKAVK